MTLSKRELVGALVLLGVFFVAYIWMEREFTVMRQALQVANARLPCEAIPKTDGKAVKRFRYDPATEKLINVETGETW